MTYSLKDLLAELEQVFVAENKVGILVIDTDTLKDFLTDRITKLVTEAAGEMELHTHNSIPSYTADLDEGCVLCIENNLRQQMLSVINQEL